MPRRPVSNRLFQWLLRLFPAEFRGDFGPQMTEDFVDQRASVASGGRRGVAGLWFRTVTDFIRRAPAEHFDIVRRDAAYAVRLLRRRPGFSVTVVLTLAIGIGLNTAVFSVVSGVLLRDLAVPNGGRVVRLYGVDPKNPDARTDAPATHFLEWQARARTVDALALSALDMGVLKTTDGVPERVTGLMVTEGFFDILGVHPVLGRGFTAQEHQNGTMLFARDVRRSVVLLSHVLWQQRFNGRPSVVGTTILIEDRPLEVVGVMGPELPRTGIGVGRSIAAAFWVPGRPSDRSNFGASPIARLAPGASAEEAEREINAIEATLEATSPSSESRTRVHVGSPIEGLVQNAGKQIWLVAAAALCVLLVTAANVANLVLGHASGRRLELTTRVAIGASRLQLVRQMLTETIVLSGIGGAGGVLLAFWAVPVLVGIAPNVPRLDQVTVDTRVLVFALFMSVAVGIGCGLAACVSLGQTTQAAIRSSRIDGFGRGRRLRQGLTVAQVALALLLVVGAGLLVRTMQALGALELGFDPANVIAVQASPPRLEGRDIRAEAEFRAALIEQVRTIPGVIALGTGAMPFRPATGTSVGSSAQGPFDRSEVDPVTPGYLVALRTKVIRGRLFTEDDQRSASKLALVSESAVRRFWRGADPIGQPIFLDGGDDQATVVGVVADVRRSGLEGEFEPTIYTLQTQTSNLGLSTLMIRTDKDPRAILPAVRVALKRIDPDVPLTAMGTLEGSVRAELAPRRFLLRLVGLFSALAVMLATLGIYGVLSEAVAQRVPEIGVRVALGATRRRIAAMVVSQGAWMVGMGIVIGLGATLVSRQIMSGFVFGVTTLDPVTYTAACLAMIAAALVACWIPARRAATIDPVVALRHE